MRRCHVGSMWRAIACVAAVIVMLSGCTPTSRHESAPGRGSAPADHSARKDAAGRAAHSATRLAADVALVAGGCTVDGCGTASRQAFLLTSTDVRPTTPMNQARDAHTATLLSDGRVLVVGGFAAEGRSPLRSAEVYDPSVESWSASGSLATGRGGHAAAPLGRDLVLVAGGWVGSHQYTATTEIYHPGTDTFTRGPRLRDAADGLAATTMADGSVLVTGGQSAPGVASDQAIVVSPDGTATEVGPLLHARFKHASVALADGRVLVIGGTPDDQVLLRSTELYDPTTRSFRPGPPLLTGRYKLVGGVALADNGDVVVAGGGRGAEALDPRTGISRMLSAVPAERMSFSTVSALGGTLRILGGYDEDIHLTGTDITTTLPE
jgi:hypothetical protein